ncbi:MAG TPA: hypothetical protein VMF55_02575 [Solirubrobacterales bacterium]|nr:hypothetical protein [Solirubrobacterales bacterium]
MDAVRNSLRSCARFLAGRWKGAPRWLYLAGTIALAFYLVNAVHFAKEPIRIEESEWPPMAKAIYETGKPEIAADQSHVIRLNSEWKQETSPLIGAWHPPLYLYTAAVSMAFVGTHSPYRLRIVGIVGLLLAAVLILLIAREVTKRWQVIGGVAAILLLINPFGIQGSTFLDIDTQVYAPILMLAIWLAIRYAKRKEALGPWQVTVLAVAIALVCWTKLTTAIVLVGVLAVWWVLARRPIRRAVVEAVAFIGAGAGLFFGTYALWCAATGIPFSYTFEVTFEQKSNRLFSEWLVVDHAVHWHLRWFGLALLILAAVYLVDLLRNFLGSWKLRPLDLPYLFALGVLVTYVLLSPTDGTFQGKYCFPALVALILPITWMLLRRPTPEQRRWVIWPVAAGLGVIAAALIGDQITHLAEFNVHYGTWDHELGIAAISGAAMGMAWLLGGRRGFGAGVIVVLAILFVAQSIHSYRANTSPLYPTPDTNEFVALGDNINAATKPDDIVVGPKDLDYYLHSYVIWGEEGFARGDALEAEAIRDDPRITVFARDSFGPPIGPLTEEVLNRCFLKREAFATASAAYRTKSCR